MANSDEGGSGRKPMSQVVTVDGSREGEIVYEATKLANVDGQGAIIECVQKHASRGGVVWRAFAELHSFVLTASGREDCVRLGGMEAVCKALRNFSPDGEVQRFGARMLGALLCAHEEEVAVLAEDEDAAREALAEEREAMAANMLRAREAGALEALSNMFKRHRADAEAMVHATRAARLLGDGATADLLQSMYEMGYVDALLRVLEHHCHTARPATVHVLEQGLAALDAVVSGGAAMQPARADVVAAGGAALLATLRASGGALAAERAAQLLAALVASNRQGNRTVAAGAGAGAGAGAAAQGVGGAGAGAAAGSDPPPAAAAAGWAL
eukprot:g7629.t1